MKKHKVAIFISSGILLLIGVLSAISCSGGTPVVSTLRHGTHSYSYRYSGTGSMDVEINMDKLKMVTGFEEGKTGKELVELLKNKTSSMNMEMALEGSVKDNEEISDFKIIKQGATMLESKNYLIGDQRWFSTSTDGSSIDKWQSGGQPVSIGDIWSSFSLEDVAKLKDCFVLKYRDSDYTTFSIRVTSENIPLLFDLWGRKSFESLSSGSDFTEFIKGMDMVMEVTLPGYKNMILPDDRISKISLNFILPFDRLDTKPQNTESRQFGDEEKKIFNSFYIDVNFDVDFFYDNVNIDRPAI